MAGNGDGTIKIDITGDTSELEKALRELGNSTSKGFDTIRQQIGGYTGSIGEAGQKTSMFGDILKANLASEAIIGGVKALGSAAMGLARDIGGSIIGMAKDGVSYNAQMETYTASFTTMLGSQSEALKLVADLKQKAAETPFGMDDLARAQQTLMGFGMSAQQAQTTMNQLGDISQGNKERFQALSLAMAQISSTGKLMGQDLLQMINAGFNPLNEISKQTGVSMADLKKKMADGAISAEMVAKALESATSAGGQFYNAMETQSKTFTGQMSTLQDNFNALKGQITEGLSTMLSGTALPMVNGWIEELSTAFETDGLEGLMGAIGNIGIDILDKMISSIPDVLSYAGKFLDNIVKGFEDNKDKIKEQGKQIIGGIILRVLQIMPTLLSV